MSITKNARNSGAVSKFARISSNDYIIYDDNEDCIDFENLGIDITVCELLEYAITLKVACNFLT